jgi:hypothetical protein
VRARAIAGTALTLLALAGAARAAGAAHLRSGCDARRPAVAYRLGRGALPRQPAHAPIPCLAIVSGRAGESATVAVLRSGRVLYAPLVENQDAAPLDDRGPARVAASDDAGRHWSTLSSGADDHYLEVPPWMGSDPQTGRIWFATALGTLCGAEISWSDDGGRHWSDNPAVGCPGMGSMRLVEGPPPAGLPKPSGYRHVVYYCANLDDFTSSRLWCYRSLDGGASFAFTGAFPDPPAQPGCDTQHPARPGAVGPNGVLYFPVYECGVLSMAISRDEGASWTLVHVADSQVADLYLSSVATDRAGDVYLAWIEPAAGGARAVPASEGILGAGRPLLAVSRDHGATWSAPRAIGPPHVLAARHVAIAAAAKGHVAVSFMASTDGGPGLDGYLTETANALAPHGLWWGAALNDPRTPLLSAGDAETFGDRLFFTTDTLSATGVPWAAFHCAKTAACAGRREGVVGRLRPARRRPGR